MWFDFAHHAKNLLTEVSLRKSVSRVLFTLSLSKGCSDVAQELTIIYLPRTSRFSKSGRRLVQTNHLPRALRPIFNCETAMELCAPFGALNLD